MAEYSTITPEEEARIKSLNIIPGNTESKTRELLSIKNNNNFMAPLGATETETGTGTAKPLPAPETANQQQQASLPQTQNSMLPSNNVTNQRQSIDENADNVETPQRGLQRQNLQMLGQEQPPVQPTFMVQQPPPVQSKIALSSEDIGKLILCYNGINKLIERLTDIQNEYKGQIDDLNQNGFFDVAEYSQKLKGAAGELTNIAASTTKPGMLSKAYNKMQNTASSLFSRKQNGTGGNRKTKTKKRQNRNRR
jgi:hypothetical protein